MVLQRLRSLGLACLQYMHAVASATVTPKQPALHIALHPFVPYVKYVAPMAAIIAIGHAFSLDAMMMRILSDDEARRRHIQEGRHGRDAIQYYTRHEQNASAETAQ